MGTSRHIKCPACRKAGPWLEGAFAPFCSERCKLIDLGKWLGEEHRFSAPLKAEHLDHLEDLGPDDGPPRAGLN